MDKDAGESENRVNFAWLVGRAEFLYTKNDNNLISQESEKNF